MQCLNEASLIFTHFTAGDFTVVTRPIRAKQRDSDLRDSVMAELGLELRGSIVDQLVEKQLDLEKRQAAKSKVEEVVALKAGWTRLKPLRQLA